MLSDGLSAQINLEELVGCVVSKLESRLNKPGVFILASPGCSRGSLVTVLLKRGLVDAVYAYVGFGSKVGDDVRGRVNEFRKIDELVGKLGGVNGRVVVVTGSTADAVRLRDKLGNAEVIYLPKYYEDAAKKVLSKDALEVARVRHEGLGEGSSPSMLREGLPSEVVKSIRELSPGKGDLKDVIKDFLKKAPIDVATQAVTTGLSFLLGVGAAVSLVGSLVGRFLESVVGKWRKNRDEVVGGFVRLVNKAREVNKNYLCDERCNERLCDERLEAVFDEVAYEWGLNIEEFANTITNIANIAERKPLTEEDVEKINDKLESIAKELNEIKTKVEGLLVGAKVFYIYDVENGLLYGNFAVEGGVPRIKTWVGTVKDDLVTDLVDVGTFPKVAEEVFRKLNNDGEVVLIGPRGIGKSTLATYVTWRALFGSLGNVVLNKPMDAVIRVDSLSPGDALALNNIIETAGKRFVIIYDPSPIKAYYKPEAMQVEELDIESVKNTLRELVEVRNAWVVIILPRELYDEVSKREELRNILNEIKRYMIDVDLKDEGFLREVIKRYSGCDNVSDDLVRRVMDFDSYTLIAKYAGIWLREKKCGVENVDMVLRESAGKPKLFFAHYIWGTILGKSMDLARRVSVPLILHAAFGPIPEGITYITKAVIEGGKWKLIDRTELAKSKLESLREDDLEPIAKWLSTLHEDLIEETLRELVGLRGEEARNNYRNHGFEDFIEALNWGYEEALGEIKGLNREVKPEKVVSNLLIFVGRRLMHALKPYTDCWKRVALIIGFASAGRVSVPRPEDLPESSRRDVAESLGDALRECDVDYYLLVGNVIPLLIVSLVIMGLAYTLALAWASVDKYNEAVAEVNRILNIARGRKINVAEILYGFGLALIIADAARLGRDVKPGDADIALYIVSFTIKSVAFPIFIILVLSALEPLRDKVPHRYLQLLARASNIGNLHLITVRYIFDKLNEILYNYGNVVKEHSWSLVYAIIAYAHLLNTHLGPFISKGVGVMVGRVVDLLNELNKFNSKLGIIAWAYALAPALMHEDVKGLMGEALRIDVVGKASEVLEELNEMRKRVQELMGDEEFVSYIESWYVKADEEAVKIEILEAASLLKHALAHHRLHNNELVEAEELFNEEAEERREIGDYENELVARSLVLRAEAIKGSLVGKELVDGFRRLYEETFSKERFIPTARYLSIASGTLGEYLVSLALTSDHETVNKLLEEHLSVLNANKRVSVLTRLMLNALLSPRGRLSSDLKGKLSVNPEEFVDAFGSDIGSRSLPALRVTFGVIRPEDGYEECRSIEDSTGRRDCRGAVLATTDDSDAVGWLRGKLINGFHKRILENERSGWLRERGFDTNELISEFGKLVYGLDGKSLVQLLAIGSSTAQLALMLHALINGNKELAKALALHGAISYSSKLLRRLFLEVYKECCDLKDESLRHAIARLFFFHV